MADKWDFRFLEVAQLISTWSKDPSTKAGAVIVDEDRRVVSIGYNGLPMGVEDKEEWLYDRDIKYKTITHAEINAIISAKRDLSGCTLYVHPFMCCSNCASVVIQSGIKRCVAPQMSDDIKSRWTQSCALARTMFEQAKVSLEEICI